MYMRTVYEWLECHASAPTDPCSIVGSVGVISASFGLDKAIAKLGIDRRLHYAGARKGQRDPFSPEKEEDVAKIREMLSDLHQQFIGHVKNRRGDKLNPKVTQTDANTHTDTPAAVQEGLDGDVYLGHKAQELGLVDQVGDLYTVLQAKYPKGYEIRVISRSLWSSWGGAGLSWRGMISAAVDEIWAAGLDAELRARLGL